MDSNQLEVIALATFTTIIAIYSFLCRVSRRNSQHGAIMLKYKDESRFQQLLGWLSFWSWYRDSEGNWKNSYATATTTIYPHIWAPSRNTPTNDSIIKHEEVHLKDAGTLFGLFSTPRMIWAVLWNILYVGFPHLLALGALLYPVTGNPWWLLSLLFLAPLPAPFRAWAEVRAYGRDILELPPEARDRAIEVIIPLFTGPEYYFMWPFPKMVKGALFRITQRI